MKGRYDDSEVRRNRENFFKKHDLDCIDAILLALTYEGNDYVRFNTIGSKYRGDGIVTPSTIELDSVFTRMSETPLMLPLADCIGAVLHDAKNDAWGIAHLGRHNLVQEGGTRNIEYMEQEFGSRPQDIIVYLSAAAGKSSYPLHDFDNKSLHEVAVEQLMKAGVLEQNIEIDGRDTTKDPELFSHSNFLAGSQETDGRHAIVAIMR